MDDSWSAGKLKENYYFNYMKDIPWFEWLYAITTDGRVWSYPKYGKSWKFLKPAWHKNGYLTVVVWKQENIHRLVAKTFIPNPENKPCVNHINGMKTDNRIENLEWCTVSHNILHAYRVWLSKTTENHVSRVNPPMKWKFWKYHPCARPIAQYDKQGNFIREWWSLIDAARQLWIQNIAASCNWRRKFAWGFLWKHL